MKREKSLWMGIVFILLSGCATTQYTMQQSALIAWKTPTLRYADMGFIYENAQALKVEVYSAGKAVMSLELLEDKVCLSAFECMGEEQFNKEALSGDYPKGTIRAIFSAKPVFEGQHMVASRGGFTQKLVKSGHYAIDYSVKNGRIDFRDTLNGIVIKIDKNR